MAARRHHTKSRNGCRECKRRKVKCDEECPCFNCTWYGVDCSLGPSPAVDINGQWSSESITPSSETASSGAVEGMGAGATSRDDFVRLDIASNCGRRHPSLAPSDGREMELMHHYSIHTCNTLASGDEMRHLWRVVLPEEGYSYPFVMHGLLAVAALHKALLIPSERKTYLDVSAHHQALGLEGFIPLLASINKDNWKPCFSFASIVVTYVCLLPLRSENQKLEDPIASILELFAVVRGIQSATRPFILNLNHTKFSALTKVIYMRPTEDEIESNPRFEHSCLPKDTLQALRRLRNFFEQDVSASARNDYIEALTKLDDVARSMAHAGLYLERGMVTFWLYTIPERILTDIRALDSFALLLLAYFCVLLDIMERHFWCIRGWSKQLLAEIEVHLTDHDEVSELINWPKDMVFKSYDQV